jgi:hypothetical protein
MLKAIPKGLSDLRDLSEHVICADAIRTDVWEGKNMGTEQIFSVQQALNVIEHMPLEDQMTVIEVLQRRLLEKRRSEIARNAATTLQAVREGRAQYGTVEDLKRDLDS